MAAGTTVCPREVIVLRIDELRKLSHGNSTGWGLGLGRGRQVALVDRGNLLPEDSLIIGVREQIAVIEHGNPGGGGFWADG
jgi:hypothetical protein